MEETSFHTIPLNYWATYRLCFNSCSVRFTYNAYMHYLRRRTVYLPLRIEKKKMTVSFLPVHALKVIRYAYSKSS